MGSYEDAVRTLAVELGGVEGKTPRQMPDVLHDTFTGTPTRACR